MSVSEPGKIITPWAESGLKNTIPPAANPATGRAGFDQGFSAINMTAKEAGGIPPFGQDFNGIFYEVTNILRYMQAGGQPTFDAALATAIGGYPKGAMVLGSDGVTLWQSKVDSNSTDPNTDPSDWGTFDIGLKADLVAPGGSDIVGFQQAGSGSVARTSQDKLRERITPQDKGAVGDGVTNDTAAFVKLEADHPAGQEIDMLGKTYYVDAPFYGHRYYNGKWVGPFGESRTRWQGAQHTGAGRIAFGDGSLAALPDTYSMGEAATVVAEGSGALGKVTQVKQAIAIGTNAMGESLIARDDIAIGNSALKNIQARDPNYSQTQYQQYE